MFGLGPMEMVVILVIALVIFGPGKLPEMGSALGKSLGEFRKATKEITDPINEMKEPFNDLKSAVSLTEPEKKVEEAKKNAAPVEKQQASPVADGTAASATCAHCQAKNEPGAKFCGGCGAALT
jgi:sec-independent protein translocase protein TatA